MKEIAMEERDRKRERNKDIYIPGKLFVKIICESQSSRRENTNVEVKKAAKGKE